MNLTERAETRRETFYKLTNSRDVPEAPSGNRNLLRNPKGPFQPKNSIIDNYTVYQNTWINMEKGKEYTLSAKGTAPFTSNHATAQEKNEICLWFVKHDENINVDRIISNATTGTAGTKFTWNDPSGKYRLRVNTYKADNSNYAEEVQIEEGNVATPYSPAPEDLGWSTDTLVPTKTQRYLWKFEYIYYSDGSVEIAGPVNLSIAGQDADATEAINKTKQELLEKLETVRDDSLEAVDEAKQGLINVNTKVDNANAEIDKAKQDLTAVQNKVLDLISQLHAQGVLPGEI